MLACRRSLWRATVYMYRPERGFSLPHVSSQRYWLSIPPCVLYISRLVDMIYSTVCLMVFASLSNFSTLILQLPTPFLITILSFLYFGHSNRKCSTVSLLNPHSHFELSIFPIRCRCPLSPQWPVRSCAIIAHVLLFVIFRYSLGPLLVPLVSVMRRSCLDLVFLDHVWIHWVCASVLTCWMHAVWRVLRRLHPKLLSDGNTYLFMNRSIIFHDNWLLYISKHLFHNSMSGSFNILSQ